MILTHPTIDGVTVKVPSKDADQWVEQGWRRPDKPKSTPATGE